MENLFIKIHELVRTTPNDSDLGKSIRSLINTTELPNVELCKPCTLSKISRCGCKNTKKSPIIKLDDD